MWNLTPVCIYDRKSTGTYKSFLLKIIYTPQPFTRVITYCIYLPLSGFNVPATQVKSSIKDKQTHADVGTLWDTAVKHWACARGQFWPAADQIPEEIF